MNYSILAMQSILPGCEFSWGEPYNYEEINWVDSRPCPTKETWEAEKARLIAYQPKQDCKDKAKQLIALTDWSQLPDRSPMIANLQAFIDYRNTLLDLILNPVNNPVFPIEPNPIWKA